MVNAAAHRWTPALTGRVVGMRWHKQAGIRDASETAEFKTCAVQCRQVD